MVARNGRSWCARRSCRSWVTRTGGPCRGCPVARDLHRKVHAVCPNGAANWADCDRVADDRYADWQAMQQVLLAYRLLTKDRTDHREAQSIKRLKKDGVFGALLRWMDGD